MECRRIVFSLLLAGFLSIPAKAQIDTVQAVPADSLDEFVPMVDSLVYVPAARLTDSLAGKIIFNVMPDGVNVRQSRSVEAAALRQIEINESRKYDIEGYRIRIFFDNSQDAREASEQTCERFRKLFPGYETYRTFIYPNFKVTVGDFRTKTEAQIALKSIVKHFPSAFIVKERMKFPVVSQKELYTVDTVRVPAPVKVVDTIVTSEKAIQ